MAVHGLWTGVGEMDVQMAPGAPGAISPMVKGGGVHGANDPRTITDDLCR
jgi:hypothetical protein